MPKKYSETEKENIRKTLRREGGTCLSLYGVRRTTVDELVRRAGIPKGTFYLFYEHKEALFLDMLTDFSAHMEEMYLAMLQELDENHIVTSLTDIFFSIVQEFYERGLHRFLDGAELDLVFRRYDESVRNEMRQHFHTTIRTLFSYFSIEDEDDIDSFSRGYEALMYLLLHAERISERERTIRFLIRGLVLQMVE